MVKAGFSAVFPAASGADSAADALAAAGASSARAATQGIRAADKLVSRVIAATSRRGRFLGEQSGRRIGAEV